MLDDYGPDATYSETQFNGWDSLDLIDCEDCMIMYCKDLDTCPECTALNT